MKTPAVLLGLLLAATPASLAAAPAPKTTAPSKSPAPAATPKLDCKLSYADLVSQITKQPGVIHKAPANPGVPDVYSNPAGTLMYFVSSLGVVGHPVVAQLIITPSVGGAAVDPSACSFGDKAGADAFMGHIADMLRVSSFSDAPPQKAPQ